VIPAVSAGSNGVYGSCILFPRLSKEGESRVGNLKE
jgi:hypothetical protein